MSRSEGGPDGQDRPEGDIVIDGQIVGSVTWTVIDVDDGKDPMMDPTVPTSSE
jgi:hypothetical protein